MVKAGILRYLSAAAAALLAACASSLPAAADAVSDFYKGKTLTMVIGYGPGGGYDIYARTIARFMTRYLPGNPNFLPVNMDGAGTIVAANWLYNVAPRDGTVVGLISGNLLLSQVLKEPGLRFDSGKFNWIGNPDAANRITFIMADTGIRTIDDLKADSSKAICGGPGVTTQSIIFPEIMNKLLGIKMKVIPGYPDGNSISLAMERGEVTCRAGNSWAGVKSASPDWVATHKINVLIQWGPQDDPDIRAYMGFHVPLAVEFAKTEADRRAVDLLTSSVAMGRPFAAPPDVPKERVDALRRAFDLTMVDPEFLAEADKLQIEIKPLTGAKLQEFVADVAQSGDDVVQRSKELTAR